MTTAHVDPLIGRVLDGRYVVRSRIARGGMATVYVATDQRLERRVAIKVMHGHLADDNAFKRRFDQEARSAARLAHPNVVNVYDQGQDSEFAYLVMEYLPGITLRDLLKTEGALTADQTLEISEAVLSGLAAAHHEKIVHRDMKPENILLADDGRIKLGDFGLARAASANTTTGQALLGTIAYLSPELVTKGVADERSDIYAFGIVLYEMITGVQPFTGEQPMQIAYQHANDEVPPPSLASSNSTPELDALVRWATQRDPQNRPADAQALLAEVHRIRAGLADGIDPAHTTVMPPGGLPTQATTIFPHTPTSEATSALTSTLRDTASHPHNTPTVTSASESSESSIHALHSSTVRRRKRGAIIFPLVLLLAVTLGTGGWWFGGGPGSLITVPDVVSLPLAEAQQILNEQDFRVQVNQCSSVDVPAGDVVNTKPTAGTRLARDTEIVLCESTGPRILSVPPLSGVPLDEALQAITAAGFKAGSVVEQQFDTDLPAGTVIVAVTEDGRGVPAELNEQTLINLITSAGARPRVYGLTSAKASEAITAAGLVHDPKLDIQSFSTEVDKARVIALTNVPETLRVGDSVGIEISQGPELFEIPNVSGQTIREAMNALTSAGFVPSTSVAEKFAGIDVWATARVLRTSPAAGTRVEKGTTVDIAATE
ncbi:Stk1 family PASTA domain-containing Ser/Thr kinase [Lysinibacter sp. HNR]|uniref:Stk1 family PASTA domain-containing Ser/Thr kinase n=1 Tax=Lysinibacter sp. HNR TaxID=3031408 RepID=UPI002434FF27|nr:Stk1 family PASTA domain-containing Ser/Thr kinase [Lysinibacter sp. HNR]WGD36481.1 Stk1 family PASTA domain-containing Ser/Thr kinase [Lysinibacter sp. HNR]